MDTPLQVLLLAEHSKDVLFRYRVWPGARVEYVSPSVGPMTGLEPRDFYERPELFRELVHPEDWPFVEATFSSEVTSTEAITVRWVLPDGKTIWTEQSLSRRRDEAGRVVAVEGIVRNVSRRVRTEQKLRESEQRLANVLHSMGDPLFVWSPDGIIESVNAAVRELLGYEERELLGKPIQSVLGPAPQDNGGLEALMAGVATRQLDVLLKSADGASFPASLNGSPMKDASGRLIGIVGVARDVRQTRRLILEARMAALAEREKSRELAATMEKLRETQTQLVHSSILASLAQLSAGISHKFNNLLTVISGYAQLLVGNDGTIESAQHAASEILTAAGRAADLVRDLEMFSCRSPAQVVAVDVGDALQRLAEPLRGLLPEAIGLEIESLDPDLVVRMNPAQLDQMVLSLAVNARDAMLPGGGTLQIRAAAGEISSLPSAPHLAPGLYVVLTVSDTGRGMSPEVAEHLFEPFFTTKGLAAATGLSLATCYGTVRRDGGHIAVETAPGQGTSFRIYLPRSCGVRERVLIVDDEPELREMVAITLRDCGYEVLEAADGLEALELVQRCPAGPPGMVLSDVVMPRMGGKDLLDRLQRIAPSLPVVLMSAHSTATLGQHGISNGIRVLKKPMSADELLSRVRECLDQRDETEAVRCG